MYRCVNNLVTAHIAVVVKTVPCLSAGDARTEEGDDTYATHQFNFLIVHFPTRKKEQHLHNDSGLKQSYRLVFHRLVRLRSVSSSSLAVALQSAICERHHLPHLEMVSRAFWSDVWPARRSGIVM
jgi:hypothetical protein